MLSGKFYGDGGGGGRQLMLLLNDFSTPLDFQHTVIIIF
jgi:hypothetical protein